MNKLNRSASLRMSNAVRNWIMRLEDYPGWKAWKRSSIGYTLHFDDDFVQPKRGATEFKFSTEIEAEHAVITGYLGLLDTARSLRDIEWYFRRYPFRGTPVTRHSHLTHCCEMYFGRFYQFSERLKKLSKAIKQTGPKHNVDFGRFIKLFNKTFDDEIRARHSVHHRERFEDVAISRVFLTESFAMSKPEQGWRNEHLGHYRRAANEWAERVQRRADLLDEFVEAMAEATLKVCPFLDDRDESSDEVLD